MRVARIEMELKGIHQDVEQFRIALKEMPLLIYQLGELTKALKDGSSKLTSLQTTVGNWKFAAIAFAIAMSAVWSFALDVWGVFKR